MRFSPSASRMARCFRASRMPPVRPAYRGKEGHAGLRRTHHGVGRRLAREVGAQAHALELEDLGGHILGHVAELEVAAPHAALAQEALGAGVEAEEGDLLRVRLVQHLGEGYELIARQVDVLLVDLVGQDREPVGLGEVDDHGDVVLVQHRAGGVAGVDHADRPSRSVPSAFAWARKPPAWRGSASSRWPRPGSRAPCALRRG